MSGWAAIGLIFAATIGASFLFTLACLAGARVAKWLIEILKL